jgi:glycosyltransferase involved in cell wall biosynthesis
MATGGTREILSTPESGVLVEDADALGPALGRLVGDPAFRARIVAGAHERARAYAPEVLAPRYEAVYRRLAQ